ncbi:MAG: hypothetical protein IJN54_14590 [Lachnospiraceae bacterium]|nr:hypothetical protein [Lachnospiraceae bacterium]
MSEKDMVLALQENEPEATALGTLTITVTITTRVTIGWSTASNNCDNG